MTAEARKLAQEMLDGLEGVTPGPYRVRRNGKHHALVGGGMWFVGLKWTVIEKRNEADAEHFRRCSPENIALLCHALLQREGT